MMDTGQLLSTLGARDIRLWVEDGRLKVSAPQGALSDELKSELASRKADLLAYLEKAAAKAREPSTVVPIKADGRRRPVFAVSGHSGDIYYLLGMSRALDPEQPLIGVQPPGLDGSRAPLTTVEDLARYEIGEIKRIQPHGPYLVAGHCAGGTIAFEVAQQLTAAGETVAMLALIGAPFCRQFQPRILAAESTRRRLKRLTSGGLADGVAHVRDRLREHLRKKEPAAPSDPKELARIAVESSTVAAVARYEPRRYPGLLDLFVTADRYHRADRWRRYAGATREHMIRDYEIDDLLLGPNAHLLGKLLQRRLDSL